MHRSREERIQAITAAALDLKERIMEQSQKLAGAGAPKSVGSKFSNTQTYFQSADVEDMENVPGGSGLREHSTMLEDELPGVGRLQEHAALVEKERRENEAAQRIQATYRGYAVRKILQRPLPAGGTFGREVGGVSRTVGSVSTALPGARRGGDGGEEGEESDSGTLTPEEEEDGKNATPTPITRSTKATPTRSAGGAAQHPKPLGKATPLGVATPPVNQGDPWKRTGGDAHSIINVFTRHHKGVLLEPASRQSDHYTLQSQHHLAVTPKLKVTPDTAYSYTPYSQQSSENSPSSQLVTPPTSKRTPPHSTPRETTLETAYSYSQTFETASETGGKDQGEGGSISEQFSQDSLASADSYGVHEQKSGSARSSPRSASDHTPTTTPPRRKYGSSASDSQSSQKSSSTRSTSHTVTQQDVTNSISAITPPGSPSFVETFASTSAPKLAPPLPPPSQGHPRLPAHSLDHQLQTELKVLETVEDSLQRVTQAESLAKQKLAQLMESATASSGAHQQVPASVAQNIATSAASAAAREAVRVVLKHTRGGGKGGGRPKKGESGLQETSYNSDFGSTAATTTTTSSTTTATELTGTLPLHADHTPDHTSRDHTSHVSELISDHASDNTPTGMDKDTSLASVPESVTPVPSDATPVPSERIARSADDEEDSNEEVEEDITEVTCIDIIKHPVA